MHKRVPGLVSLVLLFALFFTCGSTVAYADTIQSQNYRLDEPAIGVGDMNQASSANFQGINATGDIAIGNASSASYQINAGPPTTPDPALSFAVIDGSPIFNDFSATAAATTTSRFSVSNYTSYGYVVQIFGTPPTNGSHVITAMGSTGPSQTGTEQFGINLVANTQPTSFGLNPDNGQFGFGTVDANYNTSNQYRYVNSETVASAPKSSGVTTYTISYLVNVTSTTPGGKYDSSQTIIVTGTY